MAISVENANLVWQKVNVALDSLGASGASRDIFRALKAHLSQVKGNKNLQFVPFTEAQCDAAGGTPIVDAACTLYGVFVKKENEGTDNLFGYYDDATNDTTAANALGFASLKVAKQEVPQIYPDGLPVATGITVTQYLSSSGIGAGDGSNGGNGFVIIGAA